nr:hypothetical protein [Allomuricauda sp.]
MMKWKFLFLAFLLYGCNEKKISSSDLDHLNGYWEIKEVTFSNGSKKEYGVSPAIDFMHFEKMKGFRKKVYPKLNGTFDTSNSSESFQITETDNGFVFEYSTESANWQERLLEIDSISFAVVNEEGLTYAYRRFEPINIVQ